MTQFDLATVYFEQDVAVQLIGSKGGDADIIAAARVSTQGDRSLEALTSDPAEAKGLINFLMKNRHGSPFEHAQMTFFVKAPIVVFREFHRHRIGWSYNEESGRYKQLEPNFYVPPRHRPLVQVGKPGAYTFVPGSDEQYERVVEAFHATALYCYDQYLGLLDLGVAKEVARDVLPFSIFSSMYATANPRSIMHYLSLRTENEDAVFVSRPMWEIQQVANKIEALFADQFPITYAAWCAAGRVAP